MLDCGIILLSFAIALVLTGRVQRVLLRRGLLDRPNERSSHKIPVPRGGGWALLPVLITGMLVTVSWQYNFLPHAGLIAGVLLLAAISWFDDRKNVHPGLRLGLHLLAAALGSLAFGEQQIFSFLPFWLDRLILITGWGWFINLYNFMDGIDGITSVETIAVAGGSCLVMNAAAINDPFVNVLTCLLTGVCLGFLAYNWHPAKIFLGDIGSVPLGYLAGYCLLTLAVNGYWIPAAILPLYYLADSGITIMKRALRREKIWQAHRQHFYQRMAHGIGRHDRVVYWIIACNIGLIACGLLAVQRPVAGSAASAVIVALLLLKMHKSVSPA